MEKKFFQGGEWETEELKLKSLENLDTCISNDY